MAETLYDRHAQFYVDFVDRGLASEASYARLLVQRLIACLGDALAGARVCDLCCGEGHVGRSLARHGATEVVGVDLSTRLIAVARQRADAPGLSFLVDDAMALRSVADAAFDVVVSQRALMDIADHRALFAAARRVLKRSGRFVFSVLHPCFEGRPFHVTEAPPHLLDAAGQPVACAVRRYASEGWWTSGGDGIRGRMGAWHRTLSTYVNDLIAAGFTLERLEEPLPGAQATGLALHDEVPIALVLAARAA